MYRERFVYLYGLLTLVGACAVAALLLGPAVLGPPVRTELRYRDRPGMSASTSATEARARFASQPQPVDGQQLGLPAGVVCDAYELADGVALVCYQK